MVLACLKNNPKTTMTVMAFGGEWGQTPKSPPKDQEPPRQAL